MKKNILLVLIFLSLCAPVRGMKRVLEPAVQAPYGGVDVPTDVIFHIFSFCPLGTRNVLMKVCKSYAQWVSYQADRLCSAGAVRLPELHIMKGIRDSLSLSSVEIFRAISAAHDVEVFWQNNNRLQRILSWRLFLMAQDKAEQFQPLLPECVRNDYAKLLGYYPDRNRDEVTGSDHWLQISMTEGLEDESRWALLIEGILNEEPCLQWLKDGGGVSLLKMAIICDRTECIRAMLANVDYAKLLKPEGDICTQWLDLLYRACASKSTASFQLLADWLFAQPITYIEVAQLLKAVMTQIIDINRHQYLRIVIAKGKNVTDFDIWAKESLWYAFTHKKYDSVDTLLEHLSPATQSRQLPVSEQIRRCKQVVEMIFTERICYVNCAATVSELQCSLERLCTQDQLHYIKIILEKTHTLSCFDEVALAILQAALKQDNYEIVRMVIARRDYLAEGPTMLPMSTWEKLLEAIGKHEDILLFSSVLEFGFCSVMHDRQLSVAEVESWYRLLWVFGTKSIEKKDVKFLKKLLGVHKRNPTLFPFGITPLLTHALQQGAYDHAKLLLAYGACQDQVHDCMMFILKQAGFVSNTAVQVPDYVCLLKDKKPDLFKQLVEISSQTYVRQQQAVLAMQAHIDRQEKLRLEQQQTTKTLQDAIQTADVNKVQTILAGEINIQPLAMGSLIAFAQAFMRELKAAIGNIDYLQRLGRRTLSQALLQREPYEKKRKALDTIITLLTHYQHPASGNASV